MSEILHISSLPTGFISVKRLINQEVGGISKITAYKGQTVRVQFRSTTDSSLITTFRVDSTSLK